MVLPKKALFITTGALIALILVYFIFINPKNGSKNNNNESFADEQKKVEEAPIPVKVKKAQRGKLIIRISSPGQAVCRRVIVVKAEVSGVIEELLVEEGKKVKEGDLLVKLDDEKYKLQLREAESRRLEKLSRFLIEGEEYTFLPKKKKSQFKDKNKIKKEYQKALSLYQQGLISEKEFEEIKRKYELALIESGEKREEIRASVAGLTQAELEVKRAQMELEKTLIRAPFSGVITNIKVSPKEHVQAGQELFTLVDLNSIYVEAKILESEIGKIKVGREVNIRFTAYPSKIFKGYVRAISPIVDPEEKTCKIHINVANPAGEIKPGMHAEVEIASDIYEDRLIIPKEAILVRGGRKLAFVVENGLAKWRYIKTGLENEEYAEVLEGINEGELVIVEGHFTLAHDAKVKIVE
ncbi:efflux RND transporter periplasmic adaptor subunit [Candidatus Aminicenantes bacterium AC-335-A11]|jgi:RND family efflux transporter MFP subunit|nr:efflux RND transporter periplasmic adaptor subunit [SCandidatus Aminicenantes bacterium Aminicenantia_JdfR_composite]MCP2617916.1 efflux RND transporter periplasmic adaptor subunit [Candidatus Aminicenantes bacterium AC-335-A11]